MAVQRNLLSNLDERRHEREVKEENSYRVERRFGSFSRRLPLPEGIRVDQIAASYPDGVIEAKAPKPGAVAPATAKIAIT
jgi:HSP20 family protein